MSATAAILLLAALLTGGLVYLQQLRSLHLLQLEHYENQRLLVWVRRRRELVALPDTAYRGLLALALAVLAALQASIVALGVLAVLMMLITYVEIGEHARREEIKPLVYTTRAKSILVIALAPLAAVFLIALGISFAHTNVAALIAFVLIAGVSIAPAYLTITANRALAPHQRAINRRFENSARAKLATVAPRVIGITGSYGKTTTKVCVGAVLSEHEPTLITPASFNSFLGVVRTINEHLEPQHRDFVVEMGMYRAGDIAELCELVAPRIGVITAIGPAHLERMGTIEAIAAAKAELAAALPADGGQLVVNGDDPRCVEIAGRYSVPVTMFGVDNPNAAVKAENVRILAGQTQFELVINDSPRIAFGAPAPFGGPATVGVPKPAEQRVTVAADLLGTHNVSNLLAAAAVGHLIGMDIESIKRGLETVQPPEHRLQPLPNPAAGIIVIDDAYNSNPAGAAAALKVLGEHPASRRILVTPGMVELGDAEEAENQHFGELAAPVCDRVILVGPQRTVPIFRGLTAAGFDPARIDVVQNIGGATEVLAGLTRAGDVILFENDLPDLYSEDEPAPQ